MVFDNSPAYNETIDTTVEEVEDLEVLPKHTSGSGGEPAYSESKTKSLTIAPSDARSKHTRPYYQSQGLEKRYKQADIDMSHRFSHLIARETTRFKSLNVSKTTRHDQSKKEAFGSKNFRVPAQVQDTEEIADVEVIHRSTKSPKFSSDQSARQLKTHNQLRNLPINKNHSRVMLLAQVNQTIASLNRSKLAPKWLQKFGCEFCGLTLSSRFRYCLHKHCMHVQRTKVELNSDDYDTCYSILTSEY